MAVELITGVPRAGKSYYAVNYIASRCCYKDDGFYVVNDDTIIITNIDGLDLNHVPLADLLEDDPAPQQHQQPQTQEICECGGQYQLRNGKYGPFYSCSQCRKTKKATGDGVSVPSGAAIKFEDRIEKVISEASFKKLREEYGDKKIFIVIDECQQYLHTKFYNRNVFFGFEIHGHYGIDIILIAHHVSKISTQIVNICEYETRIVPRRFQIGSSIQYLEKQGKAIVGRGLVRKKQEIFDLYKSQYFEESRVKKSRLHLYVILFFLISICAVFYLKHRFTRNAVNRSISPKTAHASSPPAARPAEKPVSRPVIKRHIEPLYSASFSVVGDQIYIFTDDAYFRVQDSPYPVKIRRRSGRVVSVLLTGYSPPESSNRRNNKEEKNTSLFFSEKTNRPKQQ